MPDPLINGRTPEQIIEANRHCSRCFCDECAYFSAIECQTDLRRDCADIIKHLEAKQPTWISVKERLPEEIEQVCVAYMPHYHEYIIAEYAGCGEWVDKADLCNVTRLVTHWMPLPEPPKEAEHAD